MRLRVSRVHKIFLRTLISAVMWKMRYLSSLNFRSYLNNLLAGRWTGSSRAQEQTNSEQPRKVFHVLKEAAERGELKRHEPASEQGGHETRPGLRARR